MEKIFNVTSIFIGAIGGVAACIFGAWDIMLRTLVVLICMDYITGIIKAIYLSKLSSEIGYKGILKKIMIMCVVGLANVIEDIIGSEIGLREIVIMFFIANEGISILENAAVMLPHMPKKIKDVLLQLRDKDGGENGN